MTQSTPLVHVALANELLAFHPTFPLFTRIASHFLVQEPELRRQPHVLRAIYGIFASSPNAFKDEKAWFHPCPPEQSIRAALGRARGLRYERCSSETASDWETCTWSETVRIPELISNALRRILGKSRRQQGTLRNMIEEVLRYEPGVYPEARTFLQLMASLLIVAIPRKRSARQKRQS